MNDKKWIDDISKVFLNQKIVKIEIMTNEEAEALGWDQRAVMFQLENGTWFFASQDDEGNGFHKVYCEAGLGHYDESCDNFTSINSILFPKSEEGSDEKINCICIN